MCGGGGGGVSAGHASCPQQLDSYSRNVSLTLNYDPLTSFRRLAVQLLARYRATVSSIVTAYMYICSVSIHTLLHVYMNQCLWIIGRVYDDLVIVVVFYYVCHFYITFKFLFFIL